MESLFTILSSSPPLQKFHRPQRPMSLLSKSSTNSHNIHFPSVKDIHRLHKNYVSVVHSLLRFPSKPLQTHEKSLKNSPFLQTSLKPHHSFSLMTLFITFPCLASETVVSTEQTLGKINLESILVSIDDFFNRNPLFVAGVTFVWLIVIPLTQEYLRKFKFISAINAFRKLRDDPNSQLLDIRDDKSLGYLGSPKLKILNKGVVQVYYSEGDEDGFVKKVLERFSDPVNTTVCVLDNFDGNSMKVAELLFKSGFKEAYAIRGGIRGKNGWQEIQDTFLPPSVHVYAKKKVKQSKQLETNGRVNQQSEDKSNQAFSSTKVPIGSENGNNGYVVKSMKPTQQTESPSISSFLLALTYDCSTALVPLPRLIHFSQYIIVSGNFVDQQIILKYC